MKKYAEKSLIKFNQYINLYPLASLLLTEPL